MAIWIWMGMGMGMGMGMDNNPCQGMQSCANALSVAFNQSQRSLRI